MTGSNFWVLGLIVIIPIVAVVIAVRGRGAQPARIFVTPRAFPPAARVLTGSAIPEPIRQRFPLIQQIVVGADDLALGQWACAPGNLWGVSRAREGAHTHMEIYRICTMQSALWREDYTPTTELLHEYAHLVSQADHLDTAFWETNKQLHKEHGVSYEGQERIQREFGWYPR